MPTIQVWTGQDAIEGKSALPKFTGPQPAKLVELSTDVISKNLEEFLTGFKAILGKKIQDMGDFSLDEIELNVAISAEGGVQLLAKLEVGAKAGISLKLKRKGTD